MDAPWVIVPGIGVARRLTIAEELVVSSDRPHAPVTLGLIACTEGCLEPDRLRRAVTEVAARHPMTRARLLRDTWGRPWWCLSPAGDAAVVVVETDDELDATAATDQADAADAGRPSNAERVLAGMCSQPPPLATDWPLRVALVRQPGGDAVVLAAHHAALDGMSLAQLLDQVVRRYHDPGLPPSGVPATAGGSPAAAGATTQPVPTAAGGWDLASGHCYGVHTLTAPVPLAQAPPGGARTTVNDLLVAATHIAVERWNRDHGKLTGLVRTRIAVDLRTDVEGSFLGNRAGETMVSTGPADRAKVGLVREVVGRQTAFARSLQRVTVPAHALRWLRPVPPPLRQRLLRVLLAGTRWLLMPTVSVSNLGLLDDLPDDRTGHFRVRSVHLAGFAGPPQRLFVSAVGYAGRLHLTISYHTSLFDQAGARRFASVYLAALHDVSAPSADVTTSSASDPGPANTDHLTGRQVDADARRVVPERGSAPA